MLDFASLCGSIFYVLAGLLFYPSVTIASQGYRCPAPDDAAHLHCLKDTQVKDVVSALCLSAVSLTLAIAGLISLHNVRQAAASTAASRRIRASIHSRAESAVSGGSVPDSSVNKVRLDEVLNGTMLLAWASRHDFDQAAAPYLRVEEQMNCLEVDLTQYSTGTVANLMRGLCELEGLMDYLSWQSARGIESLRIFLEDFAFYVERSELVSGDLNQRTFPVHRMTKFEFRPLLAYYLLAASRPDRLSFVKVVDQILTANGRKPVSVHHTNTVRLLPLEDGRDQDSSSSSCHRDERTRDAKEDAEGAALSPGSSQSQNQTDAHNPSSLSPADGRAVAVATLTLHMPVAAPAQSDGSGSDPLCGEVTAVQHTRPHSIEISQNRDLEEQV
mmetsp:Transcript_36942/g.74030  ORF Transcript_36942/g.74030 Transcript_36942/m.74030 type:complete len:387 (+) Transcript_36942:485-1645(+)